MCVLLKVGIGPLNTVGVLVSSVLTSEMGASLFRETLSLFSIF